MSLLRASCSMAGVMMAGLGTLLRGQGGRGDLPLGHPTRRARATISKTEFDPIERQQSHMFLIPQSVEIPRLHG